MEFFFWNDLIISHILLKSNIFHHFLIKYVDFYLNYDGMILKLGEMDNLIR